MKTDNSTPNIGAVTGNSIRALARRLPELMQSINSQMGPNELARLQAAQLTSGGYDDLANQSYNNTLRNNAATDLDVLNTTGRDRAQVSTDIDRTINPEFYASREAGLDSLMGQLRMLSLDKANPEAERLVNLENVRSGNLSNPTEGTNTVKNALQFGDERLKRSSALTQALNTANNFMTSSKATFDPYGRSVASPNTSAQFGNVGGDANGAANNLMGNVFGTANNNATLNMNRMSDLDHAHQMASTAASYS